MKRALFFLLILFSTAIKAQNFENKHSVLFKNAFAKTEKSDWFTGSINSIRNQFKFETNRFELKLKRVIGYDIEDVAFEEQTFFNEVNLYDEIFAQIEATTYVYATFTIRI
jgi:hypothetical protein